MKISLITIYYLFVEVAFLFPRGYAEYNTVYHQLMSLLVWGAVILILLVEVPPIIKYSKKISIENSLIVTYFFLAIVITVVLQKGLSSGLQQMFAVPVFCVFLIQNMKKNSRKLLNSLSMIFIINLSLNAFLTQIAFDSETHIIFLGHVQMISQYGLAALVVAALYYIMYIDKKIKMGYLNFLKIFTMLKTDAESAVFVAIIILSGFVIYKFKLYRILLFKTEIYVLGMLALNIVIIYLTAINKSIIPGLDFSGRQFVWQNALLNIKKQPVFGYGIDGVLLHTFWTEWSGGGFNYAHNQIMQNLLDGGLVLTISFWGMIFTFIKQIKKVTERKYRVLFNSSVIALLFVMIFDSTTLYSYMYIILAIIYVVPSLCIENQYNKKTM